MFDRSGTVGLYDFAAALNRNGLDLHAHAVETLQINITKLCNQACRHCHVDASPTRTEMMARVTLDRCLELLSQNPEIAILDITGGAPELHPDFEYCVTAARALGKRVLVRHNLTVTIDGHPVNGGGRRHLPEFFAANQVEVISSLPYYQQFFTDKQRGKGVFEKSIESLKMLNALGYGQEGSGLQLNLVYNPVGAFLPAAQDVLEADFKSQLAKDHGIVFNALYTITNMPIHRFGDQLHRLGAYDEYMTKLVNAFNPAAAKGLMCRTMISVGWDGRVYDCDFNQMLELEIQDPVTPALTVFNLDVTRLRQRSIRVDSHCFGCTAGAGSSCGGATA